MKIIAKSGEDRFFVETHTSEIMALVGFSSLYEKGAPQGGFKVGDEILVHAMFKRLSAIGANQRELEKYANELSGIAVRLRELSPVIHAAEGGEKS